MISECGMLPTGFGTVSHNILSRLNADPNFEVRQLALSHRGDPEVAKHAPYIMYPVTRDGSFGDDVFLPIVNVYKPHIVIPVGDPWMSSYLFSNTQVNGQNIRTIPIEIRKNIKIITYYPLDGVKPHAPWIEQMSLADVSVFCAKFAQDAVRAINDSIRSIYIPHGVDSKNYCPVSKEQRDSYRKQFNMSGLDPFLVGMVARNQARKDYPQLFRAIAIARKIIPNLYCYCHAVKVDQGWDLNDLAHQEGVQDRVIFNQTLQTPSSGVSVQEMNLIYNSLDLFVLPTQGEGFGLPLLEAMSCGVPVLTTDYASTADLVKESGGGELIEAAIYHYRGGDHNIKRPITSETHLAGLIIDMWKNKEKRIKYGEAGRKFALKMDWDLIVGDWKKLFNSLMFPVATDEIMVREIV